MTIDSILTEWSYRLPKGYPTRSKDYELLYHVILEMTNLTPLEAQHIVNKAQGITKGIITEELESIEISSIYSDRVYRIATPTAIIIYAIQPFDDHDFDINDAATGKLDSKLISTDKFISTINLNALYNQYKFDTNFELIKTSSIKGSNIVKTLSVSTSFDDAQSFEQYIINKFSVEGQQIIGLRGMYDAIMNDPNSNELIELITGPIKMKLATGAVPIRGIHETLYTIIKDTIKIPNGDESELWFAIAYGGVVKGAVAGESGIEADIEVGDQTISLKNYEKTTFDFGSLPADAIQLLNGFLEISKLLTGTDINKSKGRDQINQVLNFLDNEKVESDIRRIIKLGTETDIPMFQNIAKKLQSFYELDDNLDTMIHAFCNIVDKMISKKIRSVKWWGMIIKSNKTLFLESSDELEPILMCRNDRLSPAIANFHQNKLFVIGSQLNTKVTTKSQD